MPPSGWEMLTKPGAAVASAAAAPETPATVNGVGAHPWPSYRGPEVRRSSRASRR